MVFENNRVTVFIRTVLYGLICVLGMFIFSPIALQMNNHDGYCVLYADKDTSYGPKSNCNYCIAIGVLFCFLYGGVMTVHGILILFLVIKDGISFNGILFVINAVTDAVSLVLVMVTGCIISVGFKELCDSFTPNGYTCSEIFLIVPGSGEHDVFYYNLAIAEGGAWICFLVYLILTVFDVFILWRNNKIPCLANRDLASNTTPSSDKY